MIEKKIDKYMKTVQHQGVGHTISLPVPSPGRHEYSVTTDARVNALPQSFKRLRCKFLEPMNFFQPVSKRTKKILFPNTLSEKNNY